MDKLNYMHEVKNPDLYLKYFNKNIIAGFPGVGKSTAAKNYPNIFIDMESSEYHWKYDDNGERYLNPEWPNNYIDSIISAAEDVNNPAVYVCISTHNEVLKALDERHIYYAAVLPKSKDIYIQRYIDRGNDKAFIDSLRNNFESYIQSVRETNVFAVYWTDGFLQDIFYHEAII